MRKPEDLCVGCVPAAVPYLRGESHLDIYTTPAQFQVSMFGEKDANRMRREAGHKGSVAIERERDAEVRICGDPAHTGGSANAGTFDEVLVARSIGWQRCTRKLGFWMEKDKSS